MAKVKHHIDYKSGEVEELTPYEHWHVHRDKCELCKRIGINLLRAKFNINPIPFVQKGKVVGGPGGWVNLCDDCWPKVLEAEGFYPTRLHKNTWNRAMDMFGSEQKRKDFVRSYITRYPSKIVMSREEYKRRMHGMQEKALKGELGKIGEEK